jgi:transcriptional regulator with XRE-family HTH domain
MDKAFNLRKELQRRMTAQGMSAAQLARQTGIAKQVLSDWLAGAMPRSITQVKTVAIVLGISVDELCFGGTPAANAESASSKGPWIRGVFEGHVRLLQEVAATPGDPAYPTYVDAEVPDDD